MVGPSPSTKQLRGAGSYPPLVRVYVRISFCFTSDKHSDTTALRKMTLYEISLEPPAVKTAAETRM